MFSFQPLVGFSVYTVVAVIMFWFVYVIHRNSEGSKINTLGKTILAIAGLFCVFKAIINIAA